MALVVSTNNGTSASSATKNIAVQNIQWADWSTSDRSANSIVLRNATAGFTTPNVVRIERSRITNIYNGSGIVANYQMPTKDGTKLFVQSNSVFSLTDTDDPTFLTYLPYVANLTLRVPNIPFGLVGLDAVRTVLMQLYGCLFRTAGVDYAVGLNALLNGALDPNTWSASTAASSNAQAE